MDYCSEPPLEYAFRPVFRQRPMAHALMAQIQCALLCPQAHERRGLQGSVEVVSGPHVHANVSTVFTVVLAVTIFIVG